MQTRDKKHWLFFAMLTCLLCFGVAGCTVENKTPVTLTPEIKITPSATINPTLTTLPTTTFTPSPVPIVLPALTMSPQEAEDALQELLKTNGNCTGKCLAGIRPEEMTVQDAINQMASWGMLRITNDQDGRTFVNILDLDSSSKQVSVKLAITLNKRYETKYAISFRIPKFGDGDFLESEVWIANRKTWHAFQFDNLLKIYGTPSFVGLSLQTWDPEGKSIAYTLDMHYEQLDLQIGIGGLARSDGKNVFICPTQDPHTLGININPERPLDELQQTSPITWQALTGSHLQAFYQTFTEETNSKGCFITTLDKIIELYPYFR